MVLNACDTAPQAAGIARSIPCVVGMTREIEDDPAIAFAAGFYQAIGFGMSVQMAFDMGCNAARLRARGQMAPDVPNLLPRKDIDPRMFFVDPETPPTPSGGDRRRRRKILHKKYLIMETIAEGPISRIDLAYDNQLKRHVAVKTLVEDAAAGFLSRRSARSPS